MYYPGAYVAEAEQLDWYQMLVPSTAALLFFIIGLFLFNYFVKPKAMRTSKKKQLYVFLSILAVVLTIALQKPLIDSYEEQKQKNTPPLQQTGNFSVHPGDIVTCYFCGCKLIGGKDGF